MEDCNGGSFHFLLTSLTRSTLRSILLVKCHPNALFFSVKGPRLSTLRILDSQIHFKPTETFQYTHFSSYQPFITKKGFIEGEALRLLRTNSVKENFFKYKRDFEQSLCNRGYTTALVHKILTEVQFSDTTKALRNKTKKAKEILPFVTTNNTATPNLKKMKHWHIIQHQPRLDRIISYGMKTQRRFSSRKTSLNHTSIIKSCK